jgi:ABC-type multidrug transport system fused ATPase/permease subunit
MMCPGVLNGIAPIRHWCHGRPRKALPAARRHPQDAHLVHDTIRANLAYARPGATEHELIEACRAAQIWDLISSLPDGLDTVAGDRGYRLSGRKSSRSP